MNSVSGGGDRKKDPDFLSPEEANKIKETPASRALDNVLLAYSLIDYGRTERSPEALITAARILARHEIKEMNEQPEITGGDAADRDPKADEAPKLDDPAALLSEAREMNPDNRALIALADQVADELKDKTRGRVGGVYKITINIPKGKIATFNTTFQGGRHAKVSAHDWTAKYSGSYSQKLWMTVDSGGVFGSSFAVDELHSTNDLRKKSGAVQLPPSLLSAFH